MENEGLENFLLGIWLLAMVKTLETSRGNCGRQEKKIHSHSKADSVEYSNPEITHNYSFVIFLSRVLNVPMLWC